MRGLWVIGAAVCLCLAAAQNSPDDLFKAIHDNNLTYLKAQLHKATAKKARDAHGNTLLMQAAAVGSQEAVKLLLESGADVNARNQFDNTALILAANQPEKARMLVEKGADVNAHTKQGRTPLMLAATCDGCVETVRLLISKGAELKAKDAQGDTALDLAAVANDLETMRLLIDKGADAATVDGGGVTPLFSAASNCNLDAVRMLLSKGADVNAADTFAGEVKFGKIQLIQLTPLMMAAPYCTVDVVKTLLDAGAKVNAKDIRDMTPLMLAVASEHQDLAVVKLLLEAGADVNVKSNMGETALDWAKKFGNREVIAELSDADAREGSPYTPPRRSAPAPRTAAQAVQSGTALLQRVSTEFFKQSGCAGCHHQPITTMAVSAARASGIHVDEAAARDHLQEINLLAMSAQEPMIERFDLGGATDPPAYFLLALAAAHFPANAITDTLAGYVAGGQRRDGTWRIGGISRSPIQEGVIGRTALAVRALQNYGPPARKAEFDKRIARARDWVAAAKPDTNDDYAMQLLSLHWTGGTSDAVERAGRALIALQRDDGGWAQNRNLASDAYATSESLWALTESGVLKVSDPVYRRGVKYLLDTQWEDGSWYVRSRAVKLQPYFQSGSPYDHDQWISSTATGFAVMALAPGIEIERTASR
jgi:ankyrin repeat protein